MEWTMLLVALAMVAASVPLAAGRIGPNRWYGFRTPRVRADERVWYPVNRMTGRNGIVYGLFLLALAAGSGLGLLGPAMVGTLATVVFVAGFIATVVGAVKTVARVDAEGPRIDYRSTFERSREHDPDQARSKLLEKLKS